MKNVQKNICGGTVCRLDAHLCVGGFCHRGDLEILSDSGFSIGDVNMDKSINIKDATAAQKHLAELINLSDEQLVLADADLSTTVNIKGVTYIQKQIAGLVEPMKPAFPMVSTAVTVADTVPQTTVTEEIATSKQETTTVTTDPTEEPVTEAPTHIPTEPEKTTVEPTTRDKNKPIELPFVPAQ